MSALLITLGVYAVPIFTKGIFWFVQMTLLSFIYIALIYHYSKIRERAWLIGVEFVNLACLFVYFVEYSITHTHSFISASSPFIIQACFVLEMLIIVGGMAIGVRKRHKVLRARDSDRDSSNRRDYLFN
jgi:sulfite exporter TauE/SafE